MNIKSNLLVFSAPSGAGKTTIVRALASRYANFVISVSVTTRARRESEKNGVDYHFVNRQDFERFIQEGLLLEYEIVHDQYYGTLKTSVEDNLAAGNVLLFDIDVNGARSIKRKYPDALLFFIEPPDLETLKQRLLMRKRETDEEIVRRLERIEFEYQNARYFDHVIINDNLDETIKVVESYIFEK